MKHLAVDEVIGALAVVTGPADRAMDLAAAAAVAAVVVASVTVYANPWPESRETFEDCLNQVHKLESHQCR